MIEQLAQDYSVALPDVLNSDLTPKPCKFATKTSLHFQKLPSNKGKLTVHNAATAKNGLRAFKIIFLAFGLFLKIVSLSSQVTGFGKTAARYHSEANIRNKLRKTKMAA